MKCCSQSIRNQHFSPGFLEQTVNLVAPAWSLVIGHFELKTIHSFVQFSYARGWYYRQPCRYAWVSIIFFNLTHWRLTQQWCIRHCCVQADIYIFVDLRTCFFLKISASKRIFLFRDKKMWKLFCASKKVSIFESGLILCVRLRPGDSSGEKGLDWPIPHCTPQQLVR